MKLRKNAALTDFISAVKTCRDDVYFETDEGDHLNLKSTLSQYIFASSVGDQSFLESGNVVCENEADYAVLADYLEVEKSF